jgi:LCP family protein required for cell wall assembly
MADDPNRPRPPAEPRKPRPPREPRASEQQAPQERAPRAKPREAKPGPDERPYTVYRSRKPLLPRFGRDDEPELGRGEQRSPRLRTSVPSTRKPWTAGRVIKWLVLAVIGWVLLSGVLFLISAQLRQGDVSSGASKALDTAVPLPFGANTILVLGSDARPKGSKEPGANVGGPSRSDTILLIRTGIGHNARLSIPRDSIADIPGQGPSKINAAYAIGGAALAIETVKKYLGIKINHVVEVNFENFPEFIDALGGINVRTGCITSEVNGGDSNGGVSVHLKPGTNHINGRIALALARTRKNSCNPAEDDRDRAKRQQQMLNAIRSRLISPAAFIRLPWIAWSAPTTIRSDMSGPSLMGLFSALAFQGSAKTEVLGSLSAGGTPLPLSSTEGVRAEAARRFLDG